MHEYFPKRQLQYPIKLAASSIISIYRVQLLQEKFPFLDEPPSLILFFFREMLLLLFRSIYVKKLKMTRHLLEPPD